MEEPLRRLFDAYGRTYFSAIAAEAGVTIIFSEDFGRHGFNSIPITLGSGASCHFFCRYVVQVPISAGASCCGVLLMEFMPYVQIFLRP